MYVSNSLINYLDLHIISLEQDSDRVRKELDGLEDLDSDEYTNLEMEEVYLNGQLVATRHILKMAKELEIK
jgi:hypothetical protein